MGTERGAPSADAARSAGRFWGIAGAETAKVQTGLALDRA